jgi:rhodanese-related sulfurtransferase
MKKIIIVGALLLLTTTLALASGYRNLNSVEAKALLEKNRNIYLLDVRTPEEFRQARLKGAVLIPISEIERRLGEIPRNKTIVVYCAVGSRSNMVAGFLAEKGYREVYNVAEGIVGLYRNGFPIVR